MNEHQKELVVIFGMIVLNIVAFVMIVHLISVSK